MIALLNSAFCILPFRTGWLVATNLNNILKKPSAALAARDAAVSFQTQTIIKLATEVAGLTFGKDVVVEF